MLRIVLPVVAATPSASWLLRGAIAAIQVVSVSAADIHIAIKIVVIVYGDFIVAAPTAAPTPASAPKRPHSYADAE